MFLRPRIIPVLLVDNRDLIKTKRFTDATYLGDPVNAVKIFNIKDVDEMTVLDISATRLGCEPDYAFLEDIASQAFMPLSYGGGIKTVDEAKRLLAIGYEKIILNTLLVDNIEMVESLVTQVGSQSVVASIDAKLIDGEYRCIVSDGDRITDLAPVALAKRAEEIGVGEIIINSVDRDGTMCGYDLELVRGITSSVKTPVTACGGAGNISDFKFVLDEGGAHAAAAGSFFVFYGHLHAVLITFPTDQDFMTAGIYSPEQAWNAPQAK